MLIHVKHLIKNPQPFRELGTPPVRFNPVNLENVETIAKVKEVKPKNNGSHTVTCTTKRLNEHGMLLSNYFLVKMPKAPKKGDEFTLECLSINKVMMKDKNGNPVRDDDGNIVYINWIESDKE